MMVIDEEMDESIELHRLKLFHGLALDVIGLWPIRL